MPSILKSSRNYAILAILCSTSALSEIPAGLQCPEPAPQLPFQCLWDFLQPTISCNFHSDCLSMRPFRLCCQNVCGKFVCLVPAVEPRSSSTEPTQTIAINPTTTEQFVTAETYRTSSRPRLITADFNATAKSPRLPTTTFGTTEKATASSYTSEPTTVTESTTSSASQTASTTTSKFSLTDSIEPVFPGAQEDCVVTGCPSCRSCVLLRNAPTCLEIPNCLRGCKGRQCPPCMHCVVLMNGKSRCVRNDDYYDAEECVAALRRRFDYDEDYHQRRFVWDRDPTELNG